MISALDSGASPQGSGPAGDIVSCSWVCHFTVTVPLSKGVYKWVPANLLLRGYPCDGLASHPGSRNDNRDKPRPDESFSFFTPYNLYNFVSHSNFVSPSNPVKKLTEEKSYRTSNLRNTVKVVVNYDKRKE